MEPVTGSLVDIVDASARDYPDAAALQFFGRETTYRQLHEAIDRAAAGLKARGVGPGDPVAIILPNCPQHIVAFYAVLRLGAVVVEHNPLYTPRELRKQFEDHGAKHAIVWSKVVATVQEFPDDLRVTEPHRRRRDEGDAAAHTAAAAPADPEGARVAHRAARARDRRHPGDAGQPRRVRIATQLREPYLVRVCSESVSGGGGGHRARRSRGVRPGEQQAVHAVVRRPGRHPQQLDAAHPHVPSPAAAPLARPDHRPAPGRGRRHLEGRRRPSPLPDPHRRQHRRADGHRRQGRVPVRGRARPLPHRGRPRRGAAHRLDGPRLPVQAAPAARRPHRARHLPDPARRHHPRPGEHQRRPAPRPVPRDPGQGRRLRRRRGDQRDRPLRRQLAQAGSPTPSRRRTPGRRTSRSRRSSRSPRRPSPPPTWRSTRAAR